MKKEKLVKKYLPVEPFDMAGLEAWFSAMAAQGLFLVKATPEKARFRRGAPQPGVRYALDVASSTGIDHERNENYAQMGWDYVTTLDITLTASMYYVYRSEDPEAPPLHTDPVTQSYTVAKLIRRLRHILVLTVIAVLLLLRINPVALLFDPWSPIRFLLFKTENALLWLALMVPYLLVRFIPQLHQLRAMKRLRRQLADGVPLDQNRRWPRRVPPSLLDWGLVGLMVIVMIVYIWIAPGRIRGLSGPEEWTFPHVTLEQALEDSGAVPESPYDKMLRPDTFRHSLLCPEQYAWDQGGEAVFPEGVQDVYLSVDYYRTRYSWAADLLVPALKTQVEHSLERSKRQREDSMLGLTILQEFQEIPCPGLDLLLELKYQVDKDPDTRYYLGRRGSQVFCLSCRGIPDPERCLTLLVEQLDSDSDF